MKSRYSKSKYDPIWFRGTYVYINYLPVINLVNALHHWENYEDTQRFGMIGGGEQLLYTHKIMILIKWQETDKQDYETFTVVILSALF